MSMLDIGTNYNFVDDLQYKSKNELINKILEEVSIYLKGSQIMELNKTLNTILEQYDVFSADATVDLDKNYEIDNKNLVSSYLATKDLEGLSKRTIEYYGTTLDKFIGFIPKAIANVTAEDIKDYFVYHKSLNDCSNKTIDNIRRVLSSFFTWLFDERLIHYNPMRTIKKIKHSQKIKTPFTTDEIEDMRFELINTNMNEKQRIRDIAIFELLLSSGIRVAECVGLNKSDIDLNHRTGVVFGKGAKEREIYFSVKAQHYIEKMLGGRNDDNPALFIGKRGERIGINGVERMIRKLGQNVEVEAYPHKFRRTFATKLLNKGVKIEEVKTLLGHSNIDTTLIYAMVDQENVKHTHHKHID